VDWGRHFQLLPFDGKRKSIVEYVQTVLQTSVRVTGHLRVPPDVSVLFSIYLEGRKGSLHLSLPVYINHHRQPSTAHFLHLQPFRRKLSLHLSLSLRQTVNHQSLTTNRQLLYLQLTLHLSRYINQPSTAQPPTSTFDIFNLTCFLSYINRPPSIPFHISPLLQQPPTFFPTLQPYIPTRSTYYLRTSIYTSQSLHHPSQRYFPQWRPPIDRS
jgi:hypothetical protein